jgi:hypothetical protein
MNIAYIYLLRSHTWLMYRPISTFNQYLLQILLAFILLGVSTISFANTHSLTFKVTQLGFSLAAKPAEAVFGEPITLVAQVEGLNSTGKVIFYNGEQQLGEFILASEHQGIASLRIEPAALHVGTHQITAHYVSDKHTNGHERAEVVVNIKAAPVSLNLSDVNVIYAPYQTLQVDNPDSPSKGAFSYHIAEDEQTIATIDEHGLITIHDGGEVTIMLKQAAHGNYQAAMGKFKLKINAGEGGITYIGGDGQVLL